MGRNLLFYISHKNHQKTESSHLEKRFLILQENIYKTWGNSAVHQPVELYLIIKPIKLTVNVFSHF